jgi:hypothetical protein
MTALGGVVAAAALLAVAAGVAKARSPGSAVRAMRAIGWPTSSALVRTGAVLEATLGVVVLVVGSWAPVVVLAASYAGFTCFNAAAIRADSIAPCGCFGDGSAQTGWRHVWFDAACAVALVIAAATGTPSALQMVRTSAAYGIATVVVAGVGAWLAATYLSGRLTGSIAGLADA